MDSTASLAWSLISSDEVTTSDAFHDKDILQLKGIFLTFDKDKDGHLSNKELTQALKCIGLIPRSNLITLFSANSTRATWFVDFNKFVEVLSSERKRLYEIKGELDCLFKFVDANQTGYMEIKELKQLLTTPSTSSMKLSPQDFEKFLFSLNIEPNETSVNIALLKRKILFGAS
jgi:Ca2+-binding EF-hand superfamily protein